MSQFKVSGCGHESCSCILRSAKGGDLKGKSNGESKGKGGAGFVASSNTFNLESALGHSTGATGESFRLRWVSVNACVATTAAEIMPFIPVVPE